MEEDLRWEKRRRLIGAVKEKRPLETDAVGQEIASMCSKEVIAGMEWMIQDVEKRMAEVRRHQVNVQATLKAMKSTVLNPRNKSYDASQVRRQRIGEAREEHPMEVGATGGVARELPPREMNGGSTGIQERVRKQACQGPARRGRQPARSDLVDSRIRTFLIMN
jgi:hypothetical protein